MDSKPTHSPPASRLTLYTYRKYATVMYRAQHKNDPKNRRRRISFLHVCARCQISGADELVVREHAYTGPPPALVPSFWLSLSPVAV